MSKHRPYVIACLVFCLSFAAVPASLRSAPQNSSQTICAAEAQFINVKATPVQSEPVVLSILTTVSNPLNECGPAQIRLTATYLDFEENPICSGIIPDLAEHSTATNLQLTHLELRPSNVLEFARWRNSPTPTPHAVRAKRLICLGLDGLAEVPSTELINAAQLKIHATVVGKHGALATAESRLRLPSR